jgi:hypothetical protein
VYGGVDQTSYSEYLHRYNTVQNKWTRFPNGDVFPYKRFGSVIHYYEGYIYMWGGEPEDVAIADSEMWRYDITN